MTDVEKYLAAEELFNNNAEYRQTIILQFNDIPTYALEQMLLDAEWCGEDTTRIELALVNR